MKDLKCRWRKPTRCRISCSLDYKKASFIPSIRQITKKSPSISLNNWRSPTSSSWARGRFRPFNLFDEYYSIYYILSLIRIIFVKLTECDKHSEKTRSTPPRASSCYSVISGRAKWKRLRNSHCYHLPGIRYPRSWERRNNGNIIAKGNP